MTPNRYLILWGIITIFISACQPDDEIPIIESSCPTGITLVPVSTDTCFEIPKNSFGEPIAFTGDHRLATMPDFNPRNSEEFVFVVENNIDSIQAGNYLARANICSGEEFPVIFFDASNPVPSGFGRLQWGATGWVAYIAGSSILRIVHSDGSNPMDLFAEGSLLANPTWIAESDQLFFVNKVGATSTGLILDINSGQILDTLETLVFLSLARFLDGKLAGVTNTGEIGYMNLQEDLFYSLHQLPSSNPVLQSPRDINWLDDKRIIWTSPSGIFSVHIETAVVDTIRYTPCENVTFSFTTVSPDEEKKLILTSRREFRYEGTDTLFFYRELALINIDTDEEWILQLD